MYFAMTIAIQGTNGSFHEQAAHILSPKSTIFDCSDFKAVFDAVNTGKANMGVVAIENNVYGSINIVYNLLRRYNLYITGEVTIPIRLFLIGSNKHPISKYNIASTMVVSQAPALAQCEHWLDKHLPLAKKQESSDTAKSVQDIIGTENLAIASQNAANLYGGTIIAGPINDTPNSKTRFLLINKQSNYSKRANRVSLILTTNHKPGALYRVLEVFDALQINLSKLDSHPIDGDERHYSFFVDCDIGINDPIFLKALMRLSELDCKYKILGSYYHEK